MADFGKFERVENKYHDIELRYKNWHFLITELVGGDTDYVYRVYVDHKILYGHSGIEFGHNRDYKTLLGAKTAVVNFIIKELL